MTKIVSKVHMSEKYKTKVNMYIKLSLLLLKENG